MPKLNPFRDMESMSRGSKDTSLRSAYSKFVERPNTMKHVAPKYDVRAGFVDPAGEANAQLAKSKANMAFLNTVVGVVDTWQQMKKADQQAAGETAFMEYREQTSDWNAKAQLNTKTYNEDTGKFEWETADQDYSKMAAKVRAQITAKYGLKDKDALHKFDLKVRQNDLAQVGSLQQFQVTKTHERTKGNWIARKSKALNAGEYAEAAQWGFENGQYLSEEQMHEDVAQASRGFNAQHEVDTIDNQGSGYTAGLLSMLRTNEQGARLKYGKNLGAIESAAMSRAVELQVAEMSSQMPIAPTREAMDQYYNSLLTKEPAELGVATLQQKAKVLGELHKYNNTLKAGLAKEKKVTDAVAKKNHYMNQAKSEIAKHRTMALLPAEQAPQAPTRGEFVSQVKAAQKEGTPLAATGSNPPELKDGAFAIDPLTSEVKVDLDKITQPEITFRKTHFSKDEVAGYNASFEDEVGVKTVDQNGNEQVSIDLLKKDTHMAVMEYADMTNGIIMPAYLNPIQGMIRSDDPEIAARGAAWLTQVIDADPTGKRMAQIKDEKTKRAVLATQSLGNGQSLNEFDIKNLEQMMSRNADQAESNYRRWDSNFSNVGKNGPEDNTLMTTFDGRIARIRETDPTLPDPPQAMLDQLEANGRVSYGVGAGYGDMGQASNDAANKTLTEWSVEETTRPTADGGTEQVRVWREDSIYAAHGDNTGTSVEVRDKIVTAVAAGSTKSFDELGKKSYRTVKATGDTWYVWDEEGQLMSNNGRPIQVGMDSPTTIFGKVQEKLSVKSEVQSSLQTIADAKLHMEKNRLGAGVVDEFAGKLIVNAVNGWNANVLEGVDNIRMMATALGMPAQWVGAQVNAGLEAVGKAKSLTNDDLNQLAEKHAAIDDGNANFRNYPDKDRKWIGMTAHALFKQEQNRQFQMKTQTQQTTTGNIAAHRVYLKTKGLIVEE